MNALAIKTVEQILTLKNTCYH